VPAGSAAEELLCVAKDKMTSKPSNLTLGRRRVSSSSIGRAPVAANIR
jgi:hypothetical protein